MKKKILAITLCVAMLAVCFGATLAYLTDQKSETNTFTVGSVKIDLLESTLHRANDAATDDMIKADAEKYQEYLAEQGANIVPGREILKAPYIVNTGKNPAYVRLRMLIPADLFVNPGIAVMTTTTAVNDGSITGPVKNAAARTIDGVVYNEYVFTYTEALEPAEMTYWPAFWKVWLNETVTSETLEAFAEAGLFTDEGAFNIIVEADAIQSEGFGSAAEAFAAFENQMAAG